MFRTLTKMAVPAAALFLALLGAATPARADALHDVRLDDEPTAIPLHTDTYLVNTNAAKGVTVSVGEATFEEGRPVSKGGGTYEMKPGEKVLIGHAHDSLRTTKFVILGAVYNDLKPTSPEKR